MHLYKNSQSNVNVEYIHKVIYNIIGTKYIYRNVYDYIDPWV